MRPYEIPSVDIQQYRYRIELHAHTKPASTCGEILPEDVVKAYLSRSYDMIVLTNHIRPNYTPEMCAQHVIDFQAARRAAEGTGLRVLFGVELTFVDEWGDYLVYGIQPEDIPQLREYVHQGLHAFAKSDLRKGCAVFTAHPYRCDKMGTELFVPELSDGVESFNLHPRMNSDNGFMSRDAYDRRLLTICGTDFHHLHHECMAAILSKTLPRDIYGLRDLLLSGDYLFDFNGNVVIPSHWMIR